MVFAADYDDFKNFSKHNDTILPLALTINKEVLNDDWSVCYSDSMNRKKNLTNFGPKNGKYKVAKYPFTMPEPPKDNRGLIGELRI